MTIAEPIIEVRMQSTLFAISLSFKTNTLIRYVKRLEVVDRMVFAVTFVNPSEALKVYMARNHSGHTHSAAWMYIDHVFAPLRRLPRPPCPF